MALDKSCEASRKQNVCEGRTVIKLGEDDHQDEDLLFEMEDEEFDRSISRSVDLFYSQHTVGSLESPVVSSSREWCLAPQLDRLGRDASFPQSLPASKRLSRRDYSSSLSSVEEATEENVRPPNYRRRTINNLEPQQVSKSPRFLPKFLRSSFSKLVPKDTSKVAGQRTEPILLSFFSTLDTSVTSTRSPGMSQVNSDVSLDSINDDNDGSSDCSPTTKQFVQDSLAKGFPIIPFYYSTAEIVEKRRVEKRNKNCFQISSNFALEGKSSVNDSNTTENTTPRIKANDGEPQLEEMHGMEKEDKSLQGLLSLAKKEMEDEACERKISDITGYASNNSRALQRRRSSVTEYMGMSLEVKDQHCQEIKVNYSFERSLVRKSVSQ